MDAVDRRIRAIAEEVAKGKGQDCKSALYHQVLLAVERRLYRSRPLVGILKRNSIPEFIGPLTQRGFQVIVREEDPGLVETLEQCHGQSMEDGHIIMPIGFGEYVARLQAARDYQKVLQDESKISSVIVTIEYPGTEENHVALYVP